MGKNIITKNMKDLLQKHNITLYSTENEEKNILCERWNRKIKPKMWKQFTVQGDTVYLDTLPKILKQYNNTKHSSIKITPVKSHNRTERDSQGVGRDILISKKLFLAGLPRARSARGTEPHTHGIWSTSFRLVVT